MTLFIGRRWEWHWNGHFIHTEEAGSESRAAWLLWGRWTRKEAGGVAGEGQRSNGSGPGAPSAMQGEWACVRL